jgi:hypothetical protein
LLTSACQSDCWGKNVLVLILESAGSRIVADSVQQLGTAWPSCACSTQHLALARCLHSPPRLTLAERKKPSVFSSLSHSLPLPSPRPHRALSLLELSTATSTSPYSGLLVVPPSRRCGLAARYSHLLVGPASPRRCAWPRGLGLSWAGLWPPRAWSAAAPPR